MKKWINNTTTKEIKTYRENNHSKVQVTMSTIANGLRMNYIEIDQENINEVRKELSKYIGDTLYALIVDNTLIQRIEWENQKPIVSEKVKTEKQEILNKLERYGAHLSKLNNFNKKIIDSNAFKINILKPL